jgi:hypothetical protein
MKKLICYFFGHKYDHNEYDHKQYKDGSTTTCNDGGLIFCKRCGKVEIKRFLTMHKEY